LRIEEADDALVERDEGADRSLRSRKAIPSGTAVRASPTLWIKSARRATLWVKAKSAACASPVARGRQG